MKLSKEKSHSLETAGIYKREIFAFKTFKLYMAGPGPGRGGKGGGGMCSAPPEDRDSREKHWDCWHYIYGTNSMPVATTLGGLTVLRFKFLTCEVLGRGSLQLSPVTITPTPL